MAILFQPGHQNEMLVSYVSVTANDGNVKMCTFQYHVNISMLYVISSSDYVFTSWLLFQEEEDAVMEWQLDEMAAKHFFRYCISKFASGTAVHFDEMLGYAISQTISLASSQHKKWKYNLKKCKVSTYSWIAGATYIQATGFFTCAAQTKWIIYLICGNSRKNSRLHRSMADC